MVERSGAPDWAATLVVTNIDVLRRKDESSNAHRSFIDASEYRARLRASMAP
jgi:hypothetical protein